MRVRGIPRPVVFTDLDGTLLDWRDYSFAPAGDALDLLRHAAVPLVPCSGRTRMEIEQIQERLDSFHPFICENGAALFIPPGYFPFDLGGLGERMGYRVVEFARPYREVVEILHQTAAQVGVAVVGFSDMSVHEVAERCGMPLLDARLAILREYDEPFRIVSGTLASRDRLLRALHRAGLRCVKGLRFDHVTGWLDKGAGFARLKSFYQRALGDVVTVGLGDDLDDLALLREVDIPIVVSNQAAGAVSHLLRKVPNARVTSEDGPAGWGQAVTGVLEELGCGIRARQPA